MNRRQFIRGSIVVGAAVVSNPSGAIADALHQIEFAHSVDVLSRALHNCHVAFLKSSRVLGSVGVDFSQKQRRQAMDLANSGDIFGAQQMILSILQDANQGE